MSECVGETAEERKKCKFYKESKYKGTCMYYVFEQFCDCLDAQIDAVKSLEEKNQEAIDEMKEAEVGKTD